MIKKVPFLNRCWLSEVGPPDGLEQRVVESEVAKACNGPRGNGAGNMHTELVLQVYHLNQIEDDILYFIWLSSLVSQMDQDMSEI